MEKVFVPARQGEAVDYETSIFASVPTVSGMEACHPHRGSGPQTDGSGCHKKVVKFTVEACVLWVADKR